MGIARVDPQFLRFGPVFNRWSDTEGWFMNKLSRLNGTKNALSQVGKPWARADLFFFGALASARDVVSGNCGIFGPDRG